MKVTETGILNMDIHNKWIIAWGSNTPPETLVSLSTDEIYTVRSWIACNRNTPVETLAVLATDENFYVRRNVTRNPNATEELLLMVNAYDKFNHLVLKCRV